jgi:alpha-mannosidase
VQPGRGAPVEVVLRNRTAGALRGEAQLLSPYGSWRQAGPWTRGFTLAAGAEETLRFDVTAPPTARAGERWWAIVKVMAGGRLHYTEPAEVTIGLA